MLDPPGERADRHFSSRNQVPMLSPEEYVEQDYLFRTLGERLPQNVPLQELLEHTREELLATTKLPMAVDFLLGELRHSGLLAPAMRKLGHYFAPFQTYVITEAESDRSRFDMRVALAVLRHEAKYRAGQPSATGLFMYQFEVLCRNRLRYDQGLEAISKDPFFDERWRAWIVELRRQIGFVEFADVLFMRSEYFLQQQTRRGRDPVEPPYPILFGEKEGKIAYANRQKDPLYLFAALQRHLGYPTVPRLQKIDESQFLIPKLTRRIEQLETRIKLLEEENRDGIDITKFYRHPGPPAGP